MCFFKKKEKKKKRKKEKKKKKKKRKKEKKKKRKKEKRKKINLIYLKIFYNLQAFLPLVLFLNHFLLNRLFDCQNKDTHEHVQHHQQVYRYQWGGAYEKIFDGEKILFYCQTLQL